MDGPDIPLAYCGAPPAPGALAGRWLLDPVLAAVLLGVALLYVLGARRAGLDGRTRFAFLAGWTVAALALVSPLCALSVSLFSARVGQHLVLALFAAPLLAAGRPLEAIAAALGLKRPPAVPSPLDAPLPAAAAFAAAMWLWHAPPAYAATFASAPLYWIMHASVTLSAAWLWSSMLRRAAGALALLAAILSTVQMSLLGALITLAPRALYAPHAATTQVWGLSPLADQQLGGALMWGPGCAAFLLIGAASLAALLREERAPAEARR